MYNGMELVGKAPRAHITIIQDYSSLTQCFLLLPSTQEDTQRNERYVFGMMEMEFVQCKITSSRRCDLTSYCK